MQPESRLSKIMGAIRACIVLLHRLHTLQKKPLALRLTISSASVSSERKTHRRACFSMLQILSTMRHDRGKRNLRRGPDVIALSVRNPEVYFLGNIDTACFGSPF